jgi:hypothetical protein
MPLSMILLLHMQQIVALSNLVRHCIDLRQGGNDLTLAAVVFGKYESIRG